jgi:hypothetical protein
MDRTTGWELAELNVAHLLAPLDDPATAEFVAALEPINALADDAAGFVWRLQTDDGDATAIRAFEDDLMIVNMSTWESLDALADFVYRSAHTDVMRRRRQWFDRLGESHLVLWWVPAGHRPSVTEAVDRLELLRVAGPCPEAFTFTRRYPAPHGAPAVDDDRWGCPAG